MSDITIILPLKDRFSLTKRWISFAKIYYKDFKILILDGSKNDKVDNYLNKNEIYNHLQIKYIRYEPDNTIQKYFNKLCDGISKVKTEFSVLIDNDDFFNPHSIKKSLNFLNQNKDFSTCGGQHMQFSFTDNKKIKFYYDNVIHSNDENLPILRLKKACAYKLALPLFYDVHRTKQIQQAYKYLRDMDSNELQMVEIFPQFIDCLNGKNKKLNDLYLIREIQIKESAHKEYILKTGSILNRLIYSEFANDYKKMIHQIIFHYQAMHNYKEENFDNKINQCLFEYLSSLISPNNVKKNTLINRFFNKIKNIRLYRSKNFEFIANIKLFFYTNI